MLTRIAKPVIDGHVYICSSRHKIITYATTMLHATLISSVPGMTWHLSHVMRLHYRHVTRTDSTVYVLAFITISPVSQYCACVCTVYLQ